MAYWANILAKGEEREGNNGHKHVNLENRTGTAREVSEEATSCVGAWACKGGRRVSSSKV